MVEKYGRVKHETMQLFERTIDQVRNKMLLALPHQASEEVKSFTTELVLSTVFKDWLRNGNEQGLEDKDVDDLGSFIQAAASLAGADINTRGFPVYQSILKGLLEDWLENWNAPGDPGPPGPG